MVSYYQYFLDVLDLINENRSRCEDFNKKYSENSKWFKSTETDVYKKEYSELNWLTKKIVIIYKGYHREMNSFYQSLGQDKKQKINRFNNQYSVKYNAYVASQTYEGEFLENVDLKKQDIFEKEFLEKVQNLHEFDYSTVDKPEKIQEDDRYMEDVATSNVQEDSEEIKLNKEIDKVVKAFPEYDLTEFWGKNRLEDIKQRNETSHNFLADVQNIISIDKKIKNAQNRINKYDNLSQTWKEKVDNLEIKNQEKVELE